MPPRTRSRATATFCWCPIRRNHREAGPLSRRVLLEMQGTWGAKRFVYLELQKIQWLSPAIRQSIMALARMYRGARQAPSGAL